MNIDKKMLMEIFRIPVISGKEEKIAKYIKEKLDTLSIPYEEDKKGNIFHFDGAKPFLNAHMDTVQSEDDYFLAHLISIKEDSIIDGLGVIGGDDKCGIYIILRLLEKGYDFNFAFTVEEEIGTVGSRYMATTKSKELRECLYGITLDRKGSTDIICYDNGYGTIEFENALASVGSDFGYKPAVGVLSDADEFNSFMSCANLSVGYYRQHTTKEFVILRDLEKAEQYTEKIINDINMRFDIPAPKVKYKKYLGYGAYYDDYMEDMYYNHKTKKWVSIDGHSTDEWDNELNEYYDELAGQFRGYKCESCGIRGTLSYVTSLYGYYCENCLVEIAEEIIDIVDANLV